MRVHLGRQRSTSAYLVKGGSNVKLLVKSLGIKIIGHEVDDFASVNSVVLTLN